MQYLHHLADDVLSIYLRGSLRESPYHATFAEMQFAQTAVSSASGHGPRYVRANFAFLPCPRLAIEPHSMCWGTELGIGSFPFEHNTTFAATPCVGFPSDPDSVAAFRRAPFTGLVFACPTNRAEQPATLVASFCDPHAALMQKRVTLLFVRFIPLEIWVQLGSKSEVFRAGITG